MACEDAGLFLPGQMESWADAEQSCCVWCQQGLGLGGACPQNVRDWGSQPCLLSWLESWSHHSTYCRSHLGVWENLGDFESATCLHGEHPVDHFSQDVKWLERLLPYAWAHLEHIRFPVPVVLGFNISQGLRFPGCGSCATNLRYANSKQREIRK